MNEHKRLDRERKTLDVMIAMYCRAHHGAGKDLCEECRQLLAHAHRRIEKCPFDGGKPTCARCRVHCYKGEMREGIRARMRYSGPRMILRHPGLALLHLLDGLRRTP